MRVEIQTLNELRYLQSPEVKKISGSASAIQAVKLYWLRGSQGFGWAAKLLKYETQLGSEALKLNTTLPESECGNPWTLLMTRELLHIMG